MNPIAKRYARAARRLVVDRGTGAREFGLIMRQVKALFAIEGAAEVLKSPVMPRDLQADLLGYAIRMSGVDDKELQSLAGRFFAQVAEAGRLPILPEIARAYQSLLDEDEGIVRAQVETAIEMDSELQQQLQAALEDGLGKKVVARFGKDPEVLGGVVVRLNNRTIDLSVRRRLRELTDVRYFAE